MRERNYEYNIYTNEIWKLYFWWLKHNPSVPDIVSVTTGKLGMLMLHLTYRVRDKMAADDIFKRIFVNENVCISIKISLKFVPKGSINNIAALVQIMAWCRPGDKPLSEPMPVSLQMHISITQPQWVNHLISSHHMTILLYDNIIRFHCCTALWYTPAATIVILENIGWPLLLVQWISDLLLNEIMLLLIWFNNIDPAYSVLRWPIPIANLNIPPSKSVTFSPKCVRGFNTEQPMKDRYRENTPCACPAWNQILIYLSNGFCWWKNA